MIFLIIFFSIFNLSAKDNFAPNRPSQSNSPWVVPVNSFMIESGINYSDDSFNENIALGVTEIRYGLSSKQELKFGFALNNNMTNKESDITSVSLNYKRELIDKEGFIPSVGILLSAITPNLTNDNIDISPGIRLIFRNTFNDFTISYNLGYVYLKDNSDFAYTFNLGYNLSSKIGIFAEIYGNSLENRNNFTSNAVDFGMNYMINDNFQVDCHLGKDISERDDFYFINVGAAFLINR